MGDEPERLPVVLVVEADEVVRELICENLLKEDVRLVTAVDGAEAIAAYCRDQPKMVLLDLSIPGIDGFEFLRWLRKEPQESRAPAIVMTAHSDRASVERAIGLGASGYVIKPFDGADVRQRVRTALHLDEDCAFV